MTQSPRNWKVGDGWIIDAYATNPKDNSPTKPTEVKGTILPPNAASKPVTLIYDSSTPNLYNNEAAPVILTEPGKWGVVLHAGPEPWIGVEDAQIEVNVVIGKAA